MFGQNNIQSQSQGFGAVPNQGNTGGLFGAGANLFSNNQAAQGFGQSQGAIGQGFGAASSAFGGTSTFGGASPFGGTQQNTGIFDNNQNAAPSQNQGSLFGQTNSVFGQPQQNTQSQGFGNLGGQGGSVSIFGAQQSNSQGIFGGQTQGGLFGNQNQTSALFGSNQTQPVSNSFSTFNKPAFGGLGQSGFGGQTVSTQLFGGHQQGFNQAQNNLQNQNQSLTQQQQQQKIVFFQPLPQLQGNPVNQQVFSLNNPFEMKNINHEEKNQKLNLRFRNIRIEAQFQNVSSQMLRYIDLISRQKGQPIDCPEWKAHQEWPQKQQRYPLNRMLGTYQQNFAQNANQIGQGFGLNQASGLQQTQLQFGAQQPQNQNSIFGQTQNQGLFAGNQSGFSQQNQNQLFSQQQPQASQGLFSQSSSGFGAAVQQPLGMFNQPQQTQQNQASSLFNQTGSLFQGGISGQQTPGFSNQNLQSSSGLLGQQNKSSIFGQTTQQQNLGLFSQQQQPQGGNALGLQPQQQQLNGSLFPNQSAGNVGIFQNNPQSQTQKQGSLFESKPLTQSTLFQNNQNQMTQQNQGGLINNNKPSLFNQPSQQQNQFSTQAQATGSLFDNKLSTLPSNQSIVGMQPKSTFSGQGSLFQGQNQQSNQILQNNPQNQLFQNNQPQQQQQNLFQKPSQPALSLFNNTQNLQSGTSLLGQQTLFNSQQPTNSLFQSQQQTTPQNQFVQQTQQPIQMDQFSQIAQNFYNQGLNDPLGIQGGFLEQPMMLKSIEQDLALIKKESDYLIKLSSVSLTTNINNREFVTNLRIGGNLQAQCQFTYPINDDEQRYKEKQMIKESALDKSNSQIDPKFSSALTNQLQRQQSYASQQNKMQKQKSIYQQNELPIDSNSFMKKQFSNISVPSLEKKQSVLEQNSFQNLNQNQPIKDVIELTIKCVDLEDKDLEFKLNVHISRDVQDVINKAENWLVKELGSQNFQLEQRPIDIKLYSLQLIKDSVALSEKDSLKKAGIISNCQLDLIYTSNQQRKRNQPSFQYDDDNNEKNIINKYLQNQLSNHDNNLFEQDENENFRPNPPNEEYETEPKMTELLQYSKQKLSSLKQFSIYNKFGMIQFFPLKGQKGIDLTNVDLKSAIQINERDVSVYEDCDQQNGVISKIKKPQVGSKLNLPAIITLNRVAPTKMRSPQEYERFLRNHLSNQGKFNQNKNDQETPEFLSYNHQTYEWMFKVPHFTKWGLEEDDQMDSISQISNQDNNHKNIEKILNHTQIKEEEKEIEENVIQNAKIEFSSQLNRYRYGSEQYNKVNQSLTNQTQQIQRKINTSQIQQQGLQFMTQASILQNKLNDKIQKRRQAVQLFTQDDNQSESIVDSQKFASKIQTDRKILVKGLAPCWRPIINSNENPQVQILTIAKQNNNQQVILNNIQTQKQTRLTKLIPVLLDKMKIINQPLNKDNVPKIEVLTKEEENKNLQMHISQILYQISLDYRIILESHEQKLDKELFTIEKLNNEFYVICLLNILFGDPRVHLIKLHPLYQLFKEQGDFQQFQKKAEFLYTQPFDDEFDYYQSEKIKRNSLIVLFKFICQQESSVKIPENLNLNENQIYQTAYELMVNGDIVKATKFLSSKKKYNVALILSQSLSATANKKIEIKQHSLQIISVLSIATIYELIRI